MGVALYDISVGCYLQTLSAVSGFMDRGLKHCTEHGIDPETIVETRLFDDMAPFRFQIASVAHHSLGAMQGLQKGVFGPPPASGPLDYKALQQLVADAEAGLKALQPETVNALEGREMAFVMGELRIPFTAENFILSFSLPNFHFHATTAYDILRTKGVPLGKRNYLGPMRMKV
jgi:hypothetical protein